MFIMQNAQASRIEWYFILYELGESTKIPVLAIHYKSKAPEFDQRLKEFASVGKMRQRMDGKPEINWPSGMW